MTVRSAVPTTVFEDACINTARVVGENKKLSVVFRGDQAYTTGNQVVLPSLPHTTRLDIDQQQIGAGYVDHETAHVLYTQHKDWLKALDANPDPLFKAIFNCLEDSRVEAKLIDHMPGSRHHLACCSDAVAQATIDQWPQMQAQGQVCLRGVGPYSLSLGGSIRNGAAGPTTVSCWGLVPDEIRDWADDQLDELAKCKNTKQTGELATRIYEAIKDPNVFNLPTPKPGSVKVAVPSGGKGAGAGAGDKNAKGKKAKAPKGDQHKGDEVSIEAAAQEEGGDDDEGKAKDADAGPDPVAGNAGDDDDDLKGKGDDEDDADGDAAGSGDGSDDDADGDDGDAGGSAPGIGDGADDGTPNPDGAGGLGDATPIVLAAPFMPDKDFKTLLGITPDPAAYTVYTREHDKVIEMRPGVEHHSVLVHHGLASYNKIVMGGRSAVIRRKIERAMLSSQLTGWKERQEEGRLDNRRLVNAYNGERDVYRLRSQAQGFDTAVQLMIDRSGSMCRGRDTLAAEAAINLCLAVEQMGVAVEVCGFQSGETHTEYDGMADRIHGVDLVVFKPFDLTTARCRAPLGAAAWATNSGTPDGDGTMMAYLRLRKRPEKRKVLITMTDGEPGTGYGIQGAASRHYQFVRDVVAWIASEGVDVIGLGIQSDCVKQFYDKWVVMRTPEDVAGTPMTELARLLLGGRFDPGGDLIQKQNRLRA